MKFFRYAIYGLTAIILISLVVLIVQPQQSQVLRPDSSEQEAVVSESSPAPASDPEQEGGISFGKPSVHKVIQKLINETDIHSLPPFIQSLPKDPTEIDRNGNRVRDDLEVYIGYKYPYNPKNRAILTQLVTAWDRMAKDGGKTKMSRQMAIYLQESMAEACWYKHGFGEADLNKLKSLVLNNKHRKEGYAKAMKVRNSIPPEELDDIIIPAEPCDQMMEENQLYLQNWQP